jgi:hypothetical protein
MARNLQVTLVAVEEGVCDVYVLKLEDEIDGKCVQGCARERRIGYSDGLEKSKKLKRSPCH